MKSSLLCLLLISGALTATGCGGGTTIGLINGLPPTVSISPVPVSIPVSTSVKFTAHVEGDGDQFDSITWKIGAIEGTDLGTVSSTTGPSTVYTAPAAPPIYDISKFPPSLQGIAGLTAINGPDNYASGSSTFIITAPSVTTFLSPSSLTLPLRGQQGFYAYAVGNVNNAITFEVNGIVGGSSTVGFIDNTQSPGLFTAPENMPPTGNTVTVTARSQADPTKSSSATITLN